MNNRSEGYPTKAIRSARFCLVTLFSCVALLTIPVPALANGSYLGWGMVFLAAGLIVLSIIATWLAWLTLLATCCKRLYREVFQHQSNLNGRELVRSTFVEVALSQVILVPAGYLVLLVGSAMPVSVLVIAAGGQAVLAACSYYIHRHTANDHAPHRFEGFIVPAVSTVSSFPALGMWMNWSSSSNHLFTWGTGGLILALMLMVLPILVAYKAKVRLYRSVSGDTAPLASEIPRIVAFIEALLIPASWLWAVWLTAAVGFYSDKGLSIPIITNAFCSVFIFAALIQAVLALAPNLGLLSSKGSRAWTPLFSSFAPAGAVALLLILVAVGMPVGSSERLNMALINAAPKEGSQEASRLIEMGANPNGMIRTGQSSGKPLLVFAMDLHRWPVVKMLLDNGANPNARDRKGRSAFISALWLRDPEIAKLMLEKGADPNARTDNGRTALMLAISRRHREIAELLVEKGADVNAKTDRGHTALMLALELRDPEITKWLLEKGSDPNAKTDKGRTVLMQALELLDPEITKLILEKGADPNAKSVEGKIALMFAIGLRDPEIAIMMLERGADPNAKSDGRENRGETALMLALRMNKPEVVAALLKKGADPNVKNRAGDTPLIQALHGSQSKLAGIQALVENGADLNARDSSGNTALMWAVRNGLADVAKLLVHNGADVNAKSSVGRTALYWAALRGNAEVAKMLLDNGADVTRKDECGDTALLRAALTGNEKLVKFLLDKGADVHDSNNMGDTPLINACINGRTDVVRLLRKYGAGAKMPLSTAALTGDVEATKRLLREGVDTNQKDFGGRTALMWAARQGHTDIAKLLLENGANVNARSAPGYTALMDAVKLRRLETARLLVDSGANVEAKTDMGSTALQMVHPQDREFLDFLRAHSGKGP